MSIKVHVFILYVIVVTQSCCYGSRVAYQTLPSYTSLTNRFHTKHNDWRRPLASSSAINVDDFLQENDEDHTEAFTRAWSEACGTKNAGPIIVPKGSIYRVKQLSFEGPCVSPVTVNIYGTIEASDDRSNYKNDNGEHWIIFRKVEGLTVSGNGIIDGNGAIWWKKSCKTDPSQPCKRAPTAMTFVDCKNLVVERLKYINAQQMHLRFSKCDHVIASDLMISTPGDSPNTDGIHVTGSNNVLIQRCVIGTGDDCISIVSGSTNVNATDITCGPGHGISIGSLGEDNSEAIVSNILVSGATLSGTTNGVRIKSWQGGSGYAKGITFQNVKMNNVSNPIIINQNYCDQDEPCARQGSAVRVNNVVYHNITGTSNTEVAIKFDCSKSVPCEGIVLKDVNFKSEQEDEEAKAVCKNISLKTVGRVYPQC